MPSTSLDLLARVVTEVVDDTDPDPPKPKYVYELDDTPHEKIRKIARVVYGAKDVVLSPTAERSLERYAPLGAAKLPICMAKTHLSFSDQADLKGAPTGFRITIRDMRASLGAGFVYPLVGTMRTMPGLPARPAFCDVDIDMATGRIEGLF